MKQIELSEKQCEFIRNATHRYNGKIGATQCGKTFLDTSFLILDRLFERRGLPGLNLIIGVTKETIERNVLEPMRAIWGEANISPISNRNICYIFGEKVYCLGGEKVSQVSKIRGSQLKYLYIDELVDINQEVFEILKSRLTLDYSICDFTGNPSYPSHYVKKFIDGGSDVYCQQWELYDNPFLSRNVISALETDYAGTVYFDRYVLGLWVAAEGIVYPLFADSLRSQPDRYIIPSLSDYLEKNNKQLYAVSTGIDFGGNKSATHFTATAITKCGELIAAMEKRIEHQIDPDKLNYEYRIFAESVLQNLGRGQTRADSAETTLINGLRKTAMAHDLPMVKNAIKMRVNDRIELEHLLMAQDRFKIVKSCTHTIDAFQSALYNPKSVADERLDNGTTDIDSLDAFEYSFEPFYDFLIKRGRTA